MALTPEHATADLLRALRAGSFDLNLVHDTTRALDAAQAGSFAAVVLEAGLPGVDTASVLTGLERLAPDTPVLLLVDPAELDGVIAGLRGERDDFLTDPYTADELVARLRLRIRQHAVASGALTRHGDIMVDTALGLVSVDGQLVTLTPTEFALLTALISNPGRTMSREQLSTMLWQEPPSSNIVEVYVGYLRRKLGPDRIRTVRGRGYVLQD
jgi:two-component system response regulator QseB